MGNMKLWGVSLSALVVGLVKLVSTFVDWTDKQLGYLTSGLTFVATLLVAYADELVVAWPPLEKAGPAFLSALASALIVMGFMPSVVETYRKARAAVVSRVG